MKKVGIIGAGQLGQMLGIAGQRLGLDCIFLDPSPDPPAAIAGPIIRKPFDDADGLRQLVDECGVLTFEFENVPVAALERVAPDIAVYPPPNALRHAQDRLDEKRLFETLGIPLPAWRRIDTLQDLEAAAGEIGLPVVLKTRRLGYDGKGQAILRADSDLAGAFSALGGNMLIAEELVAFDREVSAIAAQSVGAQTMFYPLIENRHRDGILDISTAPVVDSVLTALAHDYLRRILLHFEYVGVLTVEFFVVGDRLLANEIAPRVHNSGHWTIEGARTSQFENHLRAILDMPLGEVDPLGHAGMVNLVGTIPPGCRAWQSSSAWLHDYGKAPRPGRKLGHITVVSADPAARDRELRRIGEALAA